MSARINKPKVVRGRGRPTPAEKYILTVMQMAATDFQEWQVLNNKIATGKSVNGWVITIKAEKAKTVFRGTLTNSAHYINYALFGRSPGGNPPLEEIFAWVKAKGLSSSNMTRRQLAAAISREIGRVGTKGPILTTKIRTSIIQANTRNVLKRLSPIYTRVKGLEFVGDIVDVLEDANKQGRKVEVSSSFDKNKGRQQNYNFNAGTSFFKVKPKIKDNFFTADFDNDDGKFKYRG